MIVTLNIDRLRLYAYHGVLEQERRVGAHFYISVEAQVECSNDALVDDQLSGTVNYAEVVDVIRREMKQPSQLLEHVAYRTAQTLLKTFPTLLHVILTIEKENPPISAQCEHISVKIELKR